MTNENNNELKYVLKMCSQCPREIENKCDFPCQEALDELREIESEEQNKSTLLRDCSDCEDNDISNFLEFNVTDIEWLRVINGKIPYTTLIDKDAFLSYLERENEKYCNDNGLCLVCRNPLVKEQQIEEYCGSKMVVNEYWVCPYGC